MDLTKGIKGGEIFMIYATTRVGKSRTDPVQWDHITNSWGFWDETWGHMTCGYSTYDDARADFYQYCLKTLGWDTDA